MLQKSKKSYMYWFDSIFLSFQSTYAIETELSDFHLMTLTVMKKSFREFHPNLSIIGSTKTSQMKSLGKVY